MLFVQDPVFFAPEAVRFRPLTSILAWIDSPDANVSYFPIRGNGRLGEGLNRIAWSGCDALHALDAKDDGPNVLRRAASLLNWRRPGLIQRVVERNGRPTIIWHCHESERSFCHVR